MTQCGVLCCDLIEPVETSYGASTCCFLLKSAHRVTQKSIKNISMIYACPQGCVKCFPCECVQAAVQKQDVHVDHESLHTQPFTNMCMHTHMAWLQLGQLTVLTGSRVFVQSHLQCLNSLSNTQSAHSSTAMVNIMPLCILPCYLFLCGLFLLFDWVVLISQMMGSKG